MYAYILQYIHNAPRRRLGIHAVSAVHGARLKRGARVAAPREDRGQRRLLVETFYFLYLLTLSSMYNVLFLLVVANCC